MEQITNRLNFKVLAIVRHLLLRKWLFNYLVRHFLLYSLKLFQWVFIMDLALDSMKATQQTITYHELDMEQLEEV